MSDKPGQVWGEVPFRFTARTPEGEEIACAVLPMPLPTQQAEERRASPAPFIQSFTATSRATPQPSTDLQAASDEEIYLEWNVQGEGRGLTLTCEQRKGSAWTKLAEEPADPKAPYLAKELPPLPEGETETQLRYTLRLGPEEKQVLLALRRDGAQRKTIKGEAEYLTLQKIIGELKEAKQNGPLFKLAITATGGGARGAWEAGAGEALFHALRKEEIRPSILAGTSAGGLVATGLFADWIYPLDSKEAGDGLRTRQARLWREIARGKGSDAIAGTERGYLLRWLTDEEPGKLEKLQADWKRIVRWQETQLKAQGSLVRALAKLSFPQRAIPDYIANKVLDLAHSGLQPDPQVLQDSKALADAADKFNKASWLDKPGAAGDLALKMVDAIGHGLLAHLNPVAGVLGQLEKNARDFGKSVEDFVRDAEEASRAHREGDEAAGDAMVTIQFLIGELMDVATKDHVLDNVHLRERLDKFVRDCFESKRANRGVTPRWPRMVSDWKELGCEPQLFLTAANLSAGRLTAFAAAQQSSVQALKDEGIWTVDITNQLHPSDFKDKNGKPASEGFFNLGPGTTEDPLVKAALTTAALPFAFAVQHWDLSRVVKDLPPGRVTHDFTDGGVVDSSPIDIAVYAGATHVISLEMTPLLFNAWTYDGWGRPFEGREPIPVFRGGESVPAKRNLLDVGKDSFFTAMDGALLRTVENLVREHRDVQIYRLAPLVPRTVQTLDRDKPHKTVSPDIMNFDGVFDAYTHERRMTLDDWFMQGYLDGSSLDAPSVNSDPVFQNYSADLGKTDFPAKPIGNLYWRATTQALPIDKPPNSNPPFELLVTGV